MINFDCLNTCVGCTACASVCPKKCIEMEKNSEWFIYPNLVYPENCIKCGLCEQVCPVLKKNCIKDKLPLAYAAYSKDEDLRLDSSSGGIFTELAKKIILKKGIVYGAVYDERYIVHHCYVDKTDDLNKLRGAKYAESNLHNTFSEILNRLQNGQEILFSGTPCQVAGLKSFIRKDFDNLVCVDFVCHGVPSPLVWKTYVDYRIKEDANGKVPKSINLRSKETGWSNYQYSCVFEYEDGKKYSETSSRNLFMNLFVGDYISRPSCYGCEFKGYSRVSDITLGDFWGIWNIDPGMDDNNGTSVVLIQSEKGQQLWESIISQIEYKKVTLEQASCQNASMLVSAKVNVNANLAISIIKEGKIQTCEKFFDVPNSSIIIRMKRIFNRLMRKILSR